MPIGTAEEFIVRMRPAFQRALIDWWPAAFMMAAIFLLSSRPSDSLPDFGWADAALKKAGHVLGYGLLAVTYWRGLGCSPRGAPLAWVLAVVYGITDEVHQAFVPGRHASLWDVMFFDAPGAAVGIWLARSVLRRRPPPRNESEISTESQLQDNGRTGA